MLFLSAIIMIGCVGDELNCPAPEAPTEKNEGLYLKFTVLTRNTYGTRDTGITRTADTDGDQEGSGAENFIVLSDLRFLLFDSERKLLQDFTTEAKVVSTNGSYSVYEILAAIHEPYFDSNKEKAIDFYIMATANGQSMGAGQPEGLTPGVTSIDDICSTSQATVMTDKPLATELLQANLFDTPDRQHFPMSGFQKFTLPKGALDISSEAAPYPLSQAYTGKNLNLLRTMAKIEVVDKINITGIYNEETDANHDYRIAKVEINGFMNSGALFPFIGQWTTVETDETQQVKAPTIPVTATYVNPPSFEDKDTDISAGQIIEFADDKYASSLREDKCPVFSGYVYEYSRQMLQTGQNAPYIRVTTKGDGAAGSSMVYRMRLAEYNDGTATTDLDMLLRNHIYRFEITGITPESKEEKLIIDWTLCDMDDVSIIIPPFN